MPALRRWDRGAKTTRLHLPCVHTLCAITRAMLHVPRFTAPAALIVFLCVLAWPGAAPRAEGDPEFYDMKIMVVPVLSQRRILGHFNFSAVLELEDGIGRDEILPYIPRLRDAMLEDMKRYVDRHSDILERVDLVRVKRVLQRAAERVTGEGLIREVLLAAVSQRSFRR